VSTLIFSQKLPIEVLGEDTMFTIDREPIIIITGTWL
jgi:hypothetical protein